MPAKAASPIAQKTLPEEPAFTIAHNDTDEKFSAKESPLRKDLSASSAYMRKTTTGRKAVE